MQIEALEGRLGEEFDHAGLAGLAPTLGRGDRLDGLGYRVFYSGETALADGFFDDVLLFRFEFDGSFRG